MRPPERGRLGSVALRVAGLALLAVVAVALLAPRRPSTTYSTPRVLLCLGLLVATAALLAYSRDRLRRLAGRRVPAWAGAVLAFGSAAVCSLLAFAGRYRFGWDARVVLDISERVTAGQDLSERQYAYLSRYPNNLPLLVLDNAAQRVGRRVGLDAATVFVGVNGLALAVTLLGTYWLVAMLRGRVAALAAEGVVLVLVGLSPWMSVAYTDVVAMPFLVLGLALVVAVGRAASRRRQVLLGGPAVGCLWLAFLVKSTPVVTVAALALLAALGCLSSQAPRRLLAGGLAAGLMLFAGLTLASQQVLPAMAGVDAGRLDRSRALPPVYWMAIGATARTVNGRTQYGGYDPEAARATAAMDGAEAGRWARQRLRERLADAGPVGYLRFLGEKAAWVWGDGMFWAWGEGSDGRARDLGSGSLADLVDRWNRPGGGGYLWRTAAAQAVWLFVLLLLGARALRARWTWQTGLLLLSVAGIAGFTLLFEGRSRYLLTHVPVVVALAFSLPALLRRVQPAATPGSAAP